MLFSWAAVAMVVALVAAVAGWSTFATAAVTFAWLLVAGGFALFFGSVQHSRPSRTAYAPRRQPSPALEWEVARGAAFGAVAAPTLTHALGAPSAGVALAGVAGALLGGVVGLLVWVGTANLPEDRIPAPRRSRPRDPRV